MSKKYINEPGITQKGLYKNYYSDINAQVMPKAYKNSSKYTKWRYILSMREYFLHK